MPLGNGSCLRRTRHPFAVSGHLGLSPKIEFVFAASPETIRREPQELISLAQSANCRTWRPARCVILSIFFPWAALGRHAPVIFCRHEVPLAPIHSQQIRHHFSSYGQCCSIGIAFLLFGFIDQCQFMVLSGRQFRGFHQYTLDMFVALFGKRSPYYRRSSFRHRKARNN